MSFLQEMAAIQKAHAAQVAEIQSQPELDAGAREQRLAAAGAERDAAITRLASQSPDEQPVGKSVGAPCARCAASGVRWRANRCAARPVGVACGADTFRCRNCPRDGGTRRPCRLCAAA